MSDQNNNCACGCSDDKDIDISPSNVQGLTSLAYRIGTHSSFKKEMLDEIAADGALSKLTTRYDDDLAIATLDAWATVLDVLTFYQERICNEGYLRTSIERLSVVYLAQHINFIPAPGLAAETWLAFSMNEAQGAPATAIVPVGTKVQSIPKQNQLPQIFETAEQIEAKVKWNKITLESKKLYTPKTGDNAIYLDGVQTKLQTGDKILIVSSDHDFNSGDKDWDFRTIVNVSTNTDDGYTTLDLDIPIGQDLNLPGPPVVNPPIIIRAPLYPNFPLMRRAAFFPDESTVQTLSLNQGLLATDSLSIAIPATSHPQVATADVSEALQGKTLKAYAMRQKASLFGYNAPDYNTILPSVKSAFLSPGLLGAYYSGISFDTLIQSHADDTIDFNIPADQSSSTFPFQLTYNFSVRWIGFVLAPIDGTVIFDTLSDDGVNLWVNNQSLITHWDEHGQAEDSGSIFLQAGKLYPIQLEYFQSNFNNNANPGIIQLRWSFSGSAFTVVPNDHLFYYGNMPDWPGFSISAIASPESKTIYLDTLYPKIILNSLLVMANPGPAGKALFSVSATSESSQNRFALTSRTTKLGLSTNPDFSKFDFNIRDTFIYAQSEELQLAELPVIDPLNNKQITLGSLIYDLFTGQKIFISGKRWRLQVPVSAGEVIFTPSDTAQSPKNIRETSLIIVEQPTTSNNKIQYTVVDDGGLQGIIEDDIDLASQDLWTPKNLIIASSGKDDDFLNELHTIDSIDYVSATDSTHYSTRLTLKEPIVNYFDIPSVLINANVAPANHGETKLETLGNGDGSQIFQKFVLKQKPLTFTSADNPKGSQTTLTIRVNDIEWKEAPSFYGTNSKDKIYTVSIADDSTVTVCFGDGITGSRLPTGTANVKATYRTGIGMDGLMDATQLSMLATPQLGINKVVNPLATSGAQDPETIDSARQNAPLTVLTLDRIVSITDFENFSRAFAGISKARADIIWAGEQEIINISIALADGTMIDPSNKLYTNLLNALQDYGHTRNPINIAGYKLTGFTIDAAIAIDNTLLFEDVKLQVLNALYARFSFDVMSFGQDVTPAQIITTMQNVAGVVYVQLNQLSGQGPFATENDRLPSAIPKLDSDGKSIQLAELLVIDLNNSTISQIP